MKNGIREYPDSQNQSWTNSTAAAVASGDVVIVAGMAYIAVTDIAINDSGALQALGEFSLTAVSGDTWSIGQALGWNRTTKKLTTNLAGGIFFIATVAKTSGQVVNSVRIHNARRAVVNKLLAAGDITANATTIGVAAEALGFRPHVAQCKLVRAGVPRDPASYIWSGTNTDLLTVTGGSSTAALTADSDYLEVTLTW